MNDFTQRLIAILLVVPILVGIFRGTKGMGIAAGAIVVALFFANLDKFSRFGRGGNRPPWHYVNLPFKPESQPTDVQIRQPEPVNILTTIAQNENVVKNKNDAERIAD